jgi:hypothetical protein
MGDNATPDLAVVWSADDPRYDGRWSPKARDAAAELARLIPAIEPRWARAVTRAPST